MFKLKVLTISDKFISGGAATMARKIFLFMESKNNIENLFLYGLDKKGLPNSNFASNVRSISYLFGPHINFASNHLSGRNIFPSKRKKLDYYVDWADVIHIHNIHTYGFNYKQIFKSIIGKNKKVILTAHDDWYYTGRCAIRKECENWKNGCKKCPHLDYYHPTVFDFANSEFKVKQELISSLANCSFAVPSQHLADALSITYPNIPINLISNGIDVSVFTSPQTDKVNDEINVLVIANNYKDRLKVDDGFIKKLIKSNIRLHLVGKNSPYEGSSVTNYGYVSNRKSMNEILQKCDVFLFFSKIDSFGLVLAEALCSGLFVCAYKSRAANEVLNGFDSMIIPEDAETFIKLIKSKEFIDIVNNKNRKLEQSRLAKNKFDENLMFQKYFDLYFNG